MRSENDRIAPLLTQCSRTWGYRYRRRSFHPHQGLSPAGRYCPGPVRRRGLGGLGFRLNVTPRRTTYPLVEFQTAGGQTVRFEARTGTPWAGQKSGQPVEVVYDPHNPQHAVVSSFVELWMPPLIFLAAGLSLIAAVGLVALLGS